MGKPGKTRPPVVVDDAFIAKTQLDKVAHKRPGLVKLAAADRDYLLGMWGVFKMNIEPTIPEGPIPNVTNKYRYTPRQMWNNTKAYFEYTIEHGQPLTLSGIAAFNGLSAVDLFHKSDNIEKHYSFLNDCRQFILLYNEYAAQKKMNPAGPIFLLKNLGLKDKFEIEATGNQGAMSEEQRAEAQKMLKEFTEEGKTPIK